MALKDLYLKLKHVNGTGCDDPDFGGLRETWHECIKPHERRFFKECISTVRAQDAASLVPWLREDKFVKSLFNYSETSLQNLENAWFFKAHPICALFAIVNLQHQPEQPGKAFRDFLASDRTDGTWDCLDEKTMNAVRGFLSDLSPQRHGYLVDLVDELCASDEAEPRYSRNTLRTLRVPCVLVSSVHGDSGTSGTKTGTLCNWVFELVGEGHGGVYMSPRQSLLPLDSAFRRTESIVPDAVCRDAGSDAGETKILEGARRKHDARITLERREGSPKLIERELQGDSLTGAAAWGMYFLFSDKVPDPGIVVIASVDESRNLVGVGKSSVAAKVRAIVEHNHRERTGNGIGDVFDTIIVADTRDKAEAVKVLGSETNHICVRNMADPEDVEKATWTPSNDE